MPVRQGSICDSRRADAACGVHVPRLPARGGRAASRVGGGRRRQIARHRRGDQPQFFRRRAAAVLPRLRDGAVLSQRKRSEEHTSELQSLMRISYAVFCLKKKKNKSQQNL